MYVNSICVDKVILTLCQFLTSYRCKSLKVIAHLPAVWSVPGCKRRDAACPVIEKGTACLFNAPSP